MGYNSCSKGCGFESWHHILDGHFFTFIFCKKCIGWFKRPKINEKEAWVGPFFKKKCKRNEANLLTISAQKWPLNLLPSQPPPSSSDANTISEYKLKPSQAITYLEAFALTFRSRLCSQLLFWMFSHYFQHLFLSVLFAHIFESVSSLSLSKKRLQR